MNDEIKEILLIIKSCKQDYDKQKDGMHTFDYGELYLLYNYITNLQQENEYLKKNNPEQNIEHFRIIKENKRKINNLREENKTLKENNQNMQEEMARVWEENERLKEEQEYNNYCDKQLRKKISNLEYKITTLENYKSRCEKAIELLESVYMLDNVTITNNACEKIDNVINILQNGSDK